MFDLLLSTAGVVLVQPVFYIELLLVLLSLKLSFDCPRLGYGRFRIVSYAFSRLARRRRLAYLSTGLCALAVRLVLVPVVSVREPSVHDEFSYLLAADTFASGRLTNPTHPMWAHFETFHVNQKPSYMSIYPPAQGMVLAAGQLLGHPWISVWLSVGLMCAATCWMLQGWLPPPWALFGGFLAVARYGVAGYWMNSYSGGAVAAIGGVLLLGGLPRLLRRPRAGDAMLMGLGIAILANSRPYEGLVLCLGVSVAVIITLPRKRRAPGRVLLTRGLVPLSLVLIACAAAMLYYNWRAAGDPLRTPYQVNRDTYAVQRHFIWQSRLPEPKYNHAIMRAFYAQWETSYQYPAGRDSVKGLLVSFLGRLAMLWGFYLGPVLTLPLVMLPWLLKDRRTRPLVVIAVATLLGAAVEVFMQPHYLAPTTALVLVLVVQSARHLKNCRRHQSTGRFLVRSMPVIAIGMLVIVTANQGRGLFRNPEGIMSWCSAGLGNVDRARILRYLESQPRGHLVVVRYGPGHDPHQEWVYNRADIDKAKVVWAREMDAVRDRELLEYFGTRRVWLLEPDLTPPRLRELPRP